MPDPLQFEPGRQAALDRLARFDPIAYARSRNHLDGEVSRLSPYITHGTLSVPEVWAAVCDRYRIDLTHRFAIELGWREFFHHAWRHDGDQIFESLHAGPLPDDAYSQALPPDLIEGRTGIPVIDRAVAELIHNGWLHNHARLWLASYLVHVRKVHWRAGADWMVGHLLDGDLASNHLSWQWVAGTGSAKPYLFNADNVARFAPRNWHSARTVIDTSYEALEELARTPPRRSSTHAESRAQKGGLPGLMHEPPFALEAATRQDLEDAWVIHPWALAPSPTGRRAVGVFIAAFHRHWPWSEQRWRFVAKAMRQLTERVLWCDVPLPPSIDTVDDPHVKAWLPAGRGQPVPRLYREPGTRCRSFSAFWRRVGPDAAR